MIDLILIIALFLIFLAFCIAAIKEFYKRLKMDSKNAEKTKA